MSKFYVPVIFTIDAPSEADLNATMQKIKTLVAGPMVRMAIEAQGIRLVAPPPPATDLIQVQAPQWIQGT